MTEVPFLKMLDRELRKTLRLLEINEAFEVKWLPHGSEKLSGEVKGHTILIYEADPHSAIKTLRHEVLDYAISRVIEPYRQVTNKLIELVNEKAYKDKEQLVERLCILLE